MLASLRILMITHTYPKYPGDVTAPFLAELVEALVDQGDTVDLVLPFHPELRQVGTPGLRFFPYRYSRDSARPFGYGETLHGLQLRGGAVAALPMVARSLRRQVRSLLQEGEYDVVHAHWAIPNGALIAGPTQAAGLPLVLTLHGTDISIAEANSFARRASRRAFGSAAAITAVSEQLKRRAVGVGAPADRTAVIHNGVRLDLFTPEISASGVREQLDVPADAFLALGVGRLLEAKGFRYLIDAVGRGERLHVLIVGDGPLRHELEQAARDGNLPVTFAGVVSRERLPQIFAACDVVVVPSIVDSSGQADGGPVTVLEALAAGKPLIATPIGVAADVVEDGLNGLTIPEKDSAELAAALERLRTDDRLRARLADAGRQTAVDGLGWQRAAREYHRIYEQAAEQSLKGA